MSTKILTAAVFQTLTGETTDPAQIEEAIDASISALNIHNLGIPLLSGTAGSKSVTLTSQQYGAVSMVMRTLYVNYVKNPGGTASIGVGSLSMSYAESLSNPGNMDIIAKIAWQLKPRGILRTFG